jgi:hypothetical protein
MDKLDYFTELLVGAEPWAIDQIREGVSKLRARVEKLERFWTPVSESLPSFDVPVWLTDGKVIWIGARTDDPEGWLWGKTYGTEHYSRGQWVADDIEVDEDYRPTHWSHLPQPPVAEENISSSKPSA